MARLAGVDIDVHWSFSIVIVWVLVHGAFEQKAWQHIVFILAGILLVFGCIMLHEIGHAFVALSLNVRVKNIVLLPFGGLAKIQTVPDKPLHEILIAAAGPLVNLAIVCGLLPLLIMLANPPMLNNIIASPLTMADSIIISFFQHNTFIGMVMLLVVTNLVLFAFNLIPAFPMDGGRILRGFLALVLPYSYATRLSLAVGFTIAALLTVLAFMRGNAGLFFVAVFIFMAAKPLR